MESTPSASAATPEFVLGAHNRRSLRACLRELWLFREVVWSFASRATRVRYKQTALGVAWAVLQPLAFLAVFVLFFGGVVNVSGGGSRYAAFALSALVPWQFVSTAVSFGANSLVNDADLLRKVYFPREAPVLGSIASSLVDLGIGLVLLLLISPFLGAHLGVHLVWLPLLCAVVLIPPVAVSLPLAAMNVYYRDFRYVLPFMLQFWLFASPVAYPITEVGRDWRWVYALLDPVVGPLEGFRQTVALGHAPDWGLLGLSAASGFVLLAAGYRWFKVLEREFADVV